MQNLWDIELENKDVIKMAENKEEKDFRPAKFSWYPGHMAKTKKQIEESLKLIDIVIEVLDSRIPVSSQNPDIEKLIKNKKRIILLNKYDLANSYENELWKNYFSNLGVKTILTDCSSGYGIKETICAVEKIMQDEFSKFEEKGRVGRKIRAMVVGIPNVGKSSFINKVAKNKSLEVGNKPGVTKKQQWIRINEKIELMDTPGVLWPKLNDEKTALNLSYTGAIKDEILPLTEIAYNLVNLLVEEYPKDLAMRYNLPEQYINTVLNKNEEKNIKIYEIMQEIGRKRGQIVSGGIVDDEKTARIILDDFRNGKIGKITIEKVKGNL